jgi:hypothetical protein
MTNDQAPMTNDYETANWSLVLGHWSFTIQLKRSHEQMLP